MRKGVAFTIKLTLAIVLRDCLGRSETKRHTALRRGSDKPSSRSKPDMDTPLHRPIFCWEKIETEPPVDSDFLENRNAHLCRRGRNQHAGNGSIR
jgi:hypothetical protein